MLPRGTCGKEPACQCRRYKRLRFDPWIRKNPWRSKWQPTLIFLPGKSMDRGTWRAVVHRVAESQAWLKQLSLHPPWGFPSWFRWYRICLQCWRLKFDPWVRSHGEESGYLLQHPCLENFMDRVVWWAAVRGVAKSRTQLSDLTLSVFTHHGLLSFQFVKWHYMLKSL